MQNLNSFRATNLSSSCTNSTPWILVDTLQALSQPRLKYSEDSTIYLCEGTAFRLSSDDGGDYRWSNGRQAERISVSESGAYYIDLENDCETYQSDTLNVEFLSFQDKKDTLTFYEPQSEVRLDLNPDLQTQWFLDPDFETSISETSSLLVAGIVRDTTFYYTQTLDSHRLDYTSILDSSYFNVPTEEGNRLQNFRVNSELFLQSVSVTAEVSGTRLFGLYNRWGEALWESEVDLSEGSNELEINVTLDPDIYVLTTDEDVNISNLGTESPQLSVTEPRVDLPNEIYGYIELFPLENKLHYFYDWTFSVQFPSCEVSHGQICMILKRILYMRINPVNLPVIQIRSTMN